ncbi:YdgA family protein [Ottowia sp.]|uniref:YdgA family protein n=1 Tax=Ottowia sp. TaxID=1898956 RepID=UPI0039E4F32D
MNNKTATRLIAAAAVLGAVYVGSSWWLGQRVEARYQALLDRAATQFGADKFAERRYDRDLFGAQSTVVFQFNLPALPEEDDEAADAAPPARVLRITVQDDIRHGPLVGLRPAAARITTRVTQVEGLDDDTRQAFAKASAPEFDTLVGFGGDYAGRMLLPAGEMADPRQPGTRAEWQALTYDYTLAADGRRLTGTMHWPQASFEALEPAEEEEEGQPAQAPGAVKMRLDALKASFDMTPADDGQWLMAPGKGSGTIGTLEMTQRAPGQTAFEPLMLMRDIQMETKTTQADGLLNAVYRGHGQGSLGGVELKEMRYESQFSRLDAQALGTAQKLLMQWVSAPKADGAAVPPEAVETMARRLLDAKPEYRDSFSASTADGQAGQFGYSLAVTDLPAERAQALAGLPWQFAAMQRVRFDANLRLPKAWLPMVQRLMNSPDMSAEDMTDMAQGFVEQGWLREEGDAYLAQAEFGAGRLLLNGQPFMAGGR